MRTIPVLFAQPLIAHLGWTLLHFLWQGALIAAAYATVRGVSSGKISTHARYSLGCLSLAMMALAPIGTYGFLSSDNHGFVNSVASTSQSQIAWNGNVISPTPWYLLGLDRLDSLQRALPWLVAAWFVGVVVLLIRLVRGSIIATHLRSTGTGPAPGRWNEAFRRIAAQLDVSRSVRLAISSIVDVPVVIGWLRPMVLLPTGSLIGMRPEHIEALLAHELAHVRRHDYLVNVLQRVIESVLFYHPAVWWMSSQIRAERELCCDDLAVAASGDPSSYAHALANLEFSRHAHAHTGMAANGGLLLTRIRRLAQHTEPTPHTVFGPVAAAAVTLIVLFVGSAAAVKGVHASSATVGIVERNSIWVDTVKQGDMPQLVRGFGSLTTTTTADLQLPLSMLKEVRPGQTVSVELGNGKGTAGGTVSGINPGVKNGRVTVQLSSGALPPGVEQGDRVKGSIEVGALKDLVWLGRPFQSQDDSTGYLFKLERNGEEAVRVRVDFGRAYATSIEIRNGLWPGDKVIISDMTRAKQYDRVVLK